jgi:hypothetical protein
MKRATAFHLYYKHKVSYLTSVTVNSVILRLVYLPRPCRNFRDLYGLLSRAEQYLLQVMQNPSGNEAHRHNDRNNMPSTAVTEYRYFRKTKHDKYTNTKGWQNKHGTPNACNSSTAWVRSKVCIQIAYEVGVAWEDSDDSAQQLLIKKIHPPIPSHM